MTLETAVQDAVQAAAPETTGIDVETPDSHELKSGVISVESLFSHVHAEGGGTHWVEVPEFAEVEVGEVAGFRVSGTDLLVCRSGDDLYAYRDHCPVCEHSMAGAVLERMMGRPARDAAVLTCPTCSAHFSVYGAGARVGTGSEHLAPVPVLIRDGVLSVALADDSVIPVT